MISTTLQQIQTEVHSGSLRESQNSDPSSPGVIEYINKELDLKGLQNLGKKLIRKYFQDLSKAEGHADDNCPYLLDDVAIR